MASWLFKNKAVWTVLTEGMLWRHKFSRQLVIQFTKSSKSSVEMFRGHCGKREEEKKKLKRRAFHCTMLPERYPGPRLPSGLFQSSFPSWMLPALELQNDIVFLITGFKSKTL